MPPTSALASGGKDSTYSAYLAETQGRTVDELVSIVPADPDSGLFHTPNLSLVKLQAEAWGKPVRYVAVDGVGDAAEEAAIERALGSEAGWVVAGAIASSYQWSRVHRVCFRVGRPLYTPLWGKEAGRVVREEIAAGLDIRLVHLAAEPLTRELLGARLDLPMLEELERRSRTVRPLHVAGEGGEFETLVVDAPFWSARIEIDSARSHTEGSSTRLVVERAHLVSKPRKRDTAPAVGPESEVRRG